MKKLLSSLLIVSGLAVLASVFVPMGLSYSATNSVDQLVLIDPTETNLATAVLGTQTATVPDYTSPDTWFTNDKPAVVNHQVSKIAYYTISIPKVNLQGATVEIDGHNLKKNAIQYPGTAVPGSYGNTVIFGHSTLPQLYKIGDPLSIFNPLLKVKTGDEITINYDGVTYRYRTVETKTVKPTAIDVLAQRFDRHELTLITCTPLGTYLNRFVVHAELIN